MLQIATLQPYSVCMYVIPSIVIDDVIETKHGLVYETWRNVMYLVRGLQLDSASKGQASVGFCQAVAQLGNKYD
jgi:hypothetical protein